MQRELHDNCLTAEEILLSQRYDITKYPDRPYRQLVWEAGAQPSRHFGVLGAWKTGCLRLAQPDEEVYFTDSRGNCYTVTKRWCSACPVGFDIWNEIDGQSLLDHISQNREQVPPPLFHYLISKQAFGFVWAIFVLHCFRPSVYRLYDQHTYRAYFWKTTGHLHLGTASTDWPTYLSYCDWFDGQLQLAGLEECPWTLDQALMVLGQKLKRCRPSEHKSVGSDILSTDEIPTDGILDHTLGGKRKPFIWALTDEGGISIHRKAKVWQAELVSL